MSLAFQAGQDSWATLQVADETEERRWTQDEQLLVKQVADQLSLALENARLFQETQSHAEELAVLNEMGRELSTKLEMFAIADVVYRFTSRLMDTRNFFVALYDEKTEEKIYPLAYEEGQQVQLGPTKLGNRGFSDYIISNKKTVFAPNNVLGYMKALGIEFVPLTNDDSPSQSWIGVPMLIGDRVLGLISVQSVYTPNAYDEHDRDILTTIASQAAIAFENARLFQETQKSEAELRALFAAMNDAIIVYDREGRYVRIAPTNPSLLVQSPDEIAGKYIRDVVPPALHRLFMDAIHEALNSNKTIKIEYPLMIGGTNLWFDANVSKLSEDEVFWVARDITDRKINELIQIAITKISESTLSSKSMDELYHSIHEAVQPLLPVTNLFIAQYDPSTSLITFPYHSDELDKEWLPRKLRQRFDELCDPHGQTFANNTRNFCRS